MDQVIEGIWEILLGILLCLVVLLLLVGEVVVVWFETDQVVGHGKSVDFFL